MPNGTKKKWLKKVRRAKKNKTTANRKKMRKSLKGAKTKASREKRIVGSTGNPYLNTGNPFQEFKIKSVKPSEVPEDAEVLGRSWTEQAEVVEVFATDKVLDLEDIQEPVKDIHGNVIGQRMKVENLEEFMKACAPPMDKKKWRNKVLRFDGNEAEMFWEQDGCRFKAEFDLEPGVLGCVESLNDDELVFRTDYGTIRVQVGSRKEAKELLLPAKRNADGTDKTLLKCMKKSYQKWGFWGIWMPDGRNSSTMEQPRPRWKLVSWFHPEHGMGTYTSTGCPVQTSSAPAPEEEVA
jgi:hypothetical protein